ncbi:uncharacterized protein PHACADRAFT_29310 [Phanerochaete carnosa HHB-10118-sp]|uniref:Uncharacterized protein n=1 Tax=Phanerochaete carnosa (strain HHB-10118-sp) TaxID=650164 RepID=K5UVI9_PHACS|nr:uncharacterized protein PHACADRAFT_29310 [Phanerochaete carnosa HHB-10118-sp]EKM54041.1 hypothetical protein PHACADRAFT_29310 [Phanerochaete carnosa HHB-10118-sp]
MDAATYTTKTAVPAIVSGGDVCHEFGNGPSFKPYPEPHPTKLASSSFVRGAHRALLHAQFSRVSARHDKVCATLCACGVSGLVRDRDAGRDVDEPISTCAACARGRKKKKKKANHEVSNAHRPSGTPRSRDGADLLTRRAACSSQRGQRLLHFAAAAVGGGGASHRAREAHVSELVGLARLTGEYAPGDDRREGCGACETVSGVPAAGSTRELPVVSRVARIGQRRGPARRVPPSAVSKSGKYNTRSVALAAATAAAAAASGGGEVGSVASDAGRKWVNGRARCASAKGSDALMVVVQRCLRKDVQYECQKLSQFRTQFDLWRPAWFACLTTQGNGKPC